MKKKQTTTATTATDVRLFVRVQRGQRKQGGSVIKSYFRLGNVFKAELNFFGDFIMTKEIFGRVFNEQKFVLFYVKDV